MGGIEQAIGAIANSPPKQISITLPNQNCILNLPIELT
jgi:hypothetical protein